MQAGGLRRLPHRPVHRLGRRPVRLRTSTVLGHEGAGRGRAGRRRASAHCAAGRPRRSRCSRPQCGECVHCLSPRTNLLPCDPRAAERSATSPTARTRLSREGEPLRHFMGTSTFAEYTVMPEIALAKVEPRGAASTAALPVRLRPLDRSRRRPLHREVSSRARPACVFGCGLVGLGAVAGCATAGGRADPLRRPSRPSASSWRAHQGATDDAPRGRRDRSSGSASRPAASAPTTPSRRPATSR